MLITKEQIQQYLDSVPAAPSVIKEALSYIEKQELNKAAEVIAKEPTLIRYFQKIIAKPIFAQKEEIKDIGRIFSTLGVRSTKAMLNSYLTTLLLRRPWSLFPMTNELYFELTAQMVFYWDKILKKVVPNHALMLSSCAPMLCAAVIIADSLFAESKNDIERLRENRFIDFGTILHKMTEMTLIDLSVFIAKEWGIQPHAIEVIRLSGVCENNDLSDLNKLARYLHLLFFYILSKPEFMSAGLNDLIIFSPEYTSEIIENFMTMVNE